MRQFKFNSCNAMIVGGFSVHFHRSFAAFSALRSFWELISFIYLKCCKLLHFEKRHESADFHHCCCCCCFCGGFCFFLYLLCSPAHFVPHFYYYICFVSVDAAGNMPHVHTTHFMPKWASSNPTYEMIPFRQCYKNEKLPRQEKGKKSLSGLSLLGESTHIKGRFVSV